MSYCRWSSMNGSCDIYAYEGEWGYVVHVAGRKRINIENAPPCPYESFLIKDINEAMEEYKRRKEIWDKWADENDEYAPIGLKHDGESFTEDCLEDFRDRLLYLREVGYKFPDYVLETIEEEMKEV